MRRVAVVLLGFLYAATIGCGAQPSAGTLSQQRHYVASLESVPPPLNRRPMHDLAPNSKAAEYLAMGLSFYNASQKIDAVNAFSRALGTGNLNDQGRALAYWHLYLSQRDATRPGSGADALASFVTVSRLLLNEDRVEEDAEQEEDVKRFVEGFDLGERLFLAELMLEAVWAHRDRDYGRTPERPLRVATTQGQKLFVQLFRPCDEQEQSQPRIEFSRAQPGVHGRELDQAEIRCPGATKPVHLFFSQQ